MSIRIALITGVAGDVQGWGDLKTTELVRDTLSSLGFDTRILFIESISDLMAGLREADVDLAWPSLYYVSDNPGFVQQNTGERWIHDILESMGMPFIGSFGSSMRTMLDKVATTQRLAMNGVSVPWQHTVAVGGEVPTVSFPAFVKPRFGSESIGV